jgi:proteasome accessory factor A
MSLPTVAGIETEYAAFIRGRDPADPALAARLLLEHASEGGLPCGEGGLMLLNGGRFYLDHTHPEYCTPEAATPRDLVAADRAGELYLEGCRQRANASGRLPAGQEILLYKNNSDGTGTSYGCHENYLVTPAAFAALTARPTTPAQDAVLPFLVTRTLLCGAAKVGSENGAAPCGFQLAQRADFFETLVGLQTTHRRPLLNTRDEAHADPARFRRLHIIAGDANLAELSTFLKVGTTALVLRLLEDGKLEPGLALADPLAAVRAVSRDLTFRQELPLRGGGSMTALAIQRRYLELARAHLGASDVTDVWADTLDRLDADWRGLAGRLDWAIKRGVLERYLTGRGDWEAVARWGAAVGRGEDIGPRERETYFTLRKLDLDYHDIRRGPTEGQVGLFYYLQQRGAVERLLTDDEIAARVTDAPPDTRARVRGECLRRWRERVTSADWSEVCLREPASRLRLLDPTACEDIDV